MFVLPFFNKRTCVCMCDCVNLILFTVLLVHLSLRTTVTTFALIIYHTLDLSLQT